MSSDGFFICYSLLIKFSNSFFIILYTKDACICTCFIDIHNGVHQVTQGELIYKLIYSPQAINMCLATLPSAALHLIAPMYY